MAKIRTKDQLIAFANKHFSPKSIDLIGNSGIFVNPCPFCYHHDCFSLNGEQGLGKCFSCGEEGTLDELAEKVNGVQEDTFDPYKRYPKMKLSQSFYPEAGDGYMYFQKIVKENGQMKRVPMLLTNKKAEIRLDHKKGEFILIDNKYELPCEVEHAFMDTDILTLQHKWVEEWKKEAFEDRDLHPSVVIREIESVIRRTFVMDEDTRKILSLWIYATYVYSLFPNGFPYLVINGPTGVGKSTLGHIISRLAHNGQFTVNTTAAALFRLTSIFGGTMVFEDLEENSSEETMSVLKAGYSDKGKVYRFNGNTQMAEGFSVFSPKVIITNAQGIEDVIVDRSIVLDAAAVDYAKLRELTSINEIDADYIHYVTSTASLSAMEYFEKIAGRPYTNLETGNARLNQIIKPLVAIAEIAGGGYTEALLHFVKEVKGE